MEGNRPGQRARALEGGFRDVADVVQAGTQPLRVVEGGPRASCLSLVSWPVYARGFFFCWDFFFPDCLQCAYLCHM